MDTKILDKFMGLLDHPPILLILDPREKNPLSPLKFNHMSLDKEDNRHLVSSIWVNLF